MDNRLNESEKKYYLVSLSDGTKNMVSDGYLNLNSEFVEAIKVYAVEENGQLITLIGNLKILDVNKNYNSNIFDIRTFIDGKYNLFGIKKQEITSKQVENEITTKYNTQKKVKEAYDEILNLEKKTKEEAQKQYEDLLEAERNFREEINTGKKL